MLNGQLSRAEYAQSFRLDCALIWEGLPQWSAPLVTCVCLHTLALPHMIIGQTFTTKKLSMQPRPPIPPFTPETDVQKVRAAEDGWNSLMAVRHASINDLPSTAEERKYSWPLGRRPDDHPSFSDLSLCPNDLITLWAMT